MLDELLQSHPYKRRNLLNGEWVQVSLNNVKCDAWHWHMHFYLSLFHSATEKKIMMACQMLAETQIDIKHEHVAATLRTSSTVHYKKNVVCN